LGAFLDAMTKISQRKYAGEADQPEMIALARAFPAENLHIADLPYRFSSWAFEDPENIALWVDEEGKLQAWAVMQSPWWTIDYVYRPQAGQTLHRQILDWADSRARELLGTRYGLLSWFVNVFTDQVERIQALEAAGFVSQADKGKDSWSKVFLQRTAEFPVANYRLPDGFIVRPLAGVSEVDAYVELHRSVFETKNMTVEWRARTLRHPDYQPDLDLVVAAPDGRLVAFCVCWLAEGSGFEPCGQIEPLGCHKDFRRYALGRVALAEGLRRLQSCGVKSMYVETDNYRDTAFRLYESVGFRVIRNVLVFRKDYEQDGAND
jgi:mycothiol synthase